MRKYFLKINTLLLITYFSMLMSYGQSPKNPINILRYNDAFGSLKNDSSKTGFEKLKYISFGNNANVSFGGEVREQFQYFNNNNFGDVPPTFKQVSAGQLWHRIMAHSNIEIGKNVRFFIQLNNTLRLFNPNPLTPEIDENQLSLHQAFVDVRINKNWSVRAGRQEMSYGNNRILTFREGPNTRLTFDAVVVKYANSKQKIDVLVVSPVVSKQKSFDDVSLKEYVFGVYATENIIPKKLLLDYYTLNFLSKTRQYNFIGGNENRQSFGFRIFSQNPKLNYELESTYQSGTFNELKISAYAFSGDVNYKLVQKNNFTVGVAGNYISGDKNKVDKQLNTYNLIFSKPSYGLAAPIGSSNIVNLNPYLRMNPVPKLAVYAGVFFMQRQSNQDGTYSPGMAQLRPNPKALFLTTTKGIGTQYALEMSLQANNHLSFALDFALFQAGNYVKATGKGQDIGYFSIKSGYKF